MKNILMAILMTFSIVTLSAGESSYYDSLLKKGQTYFTKAKEAYSDYKEKVVEKASDLGVIDKESNMHQAGEQKGKLLRIPPNATEMFSRQHCDRVFDFSAYAACYDAKSKISKYILYVLSIPDTGVDIKKRPNFYPEKSLPKAERAYPRDYTHSGYDRGHSRPHASTSFNKKLLYQTYDMVNIWPQTPSLNRKIWIKAERYERFVARKLGSVDVLNLAKYSNKSKKIKGGVVVPDGFYKVLFSDDGKFKKCFYYVNKKYSQAEIRKDKLKNHLVDCSKIRY